MNVGDVYVTAGTTSVSLRMGHPRTGRHEALLTYREARALAALLAQLTEPDPAPFKGLFD